MSEDKLELWIDRMAGKVSPEENAKRMLYLSGPMTGFPEFNRQAFEDAAYRLRSYGYHVINPHELPEPEVEGFAGEMELWAEYLARDLWLFAKTSRPDALVVLPGWETSRGSMLEVAFAKKCGIPVITYGKLLVENKK